MRLFFNQGNLVGLRTAESNRSAVRSSSEPVATGAVTMSLILVTFNSDGVEVSVSVMGSAAARVFLRLLIAELHGLFLFWHCFLTSGLWFVTLSVLRPDDRI